MAMRLVTYEGKAAGAVKSIRAEIKGYREWRPLAENVFVIETNETPKQIYNKLKQVLVDETDKLYVFTVVQPAAGTGPDTVNDWVEAALTGKSKR